MLGSEAPSQQLTRSNGRGRKIARRVKQIELCPQHKPYIISSAKARVDLIFCLVLIKQLLHYLISNNQVKKNEKGGSESRGVTYPPKAFEQSSAKLGKKCTS